MFGFLKKQKPKGETVTLKIKGMHCASCAMNIDGELEELQGVIEARTNYAKAETKVVYDQALVGVNKLRQTIKATGYKVAG